MALVNVIPDLGGSFEYLLRVTGRGRVGIARGRGSADGSTGGAAAWLNVEGGDGEVAAGKVVADVGGREDVFDGPGWSVMIAPETPFSIRGNVRYTISGRAWATKARTRLIRPEDVTIAEDPGGTLTRIYASSGPLVCGETIVPAGGWAYLPTKRAVETLVLCRAAEASGFGIQVLDASDGHHRTEALEDGDVRRTRGGSVRFAAGPEGAICAIWTGALASRSA